MLFLLQSKTVNLFAASSIFVSGLLFSGCLHFQEKTLSREAQAIKIVQHLVKTQQILKAEPLVGGFSDALLMKVTGAEKTYVVRFLDSKQIELRNEHEITCQQIASDNGYGPHVYFIDAQQGVIIMEYLAAEAFPVDKDRLLAYVDLVKKIHSGTSFPVAFNLFEYTKKCLKAVEVFQQDLIDVPKIMLILDTIKKAVAHFPHSAPCHRDLHPGNVIYARGQFFAIDYTSAGQDDPYIDLAAPLFHSFPGKSDVLLTEYLGRQPTEKELAKLSLMKTLVLIFYGSIFIKNLPEAFIQKVSTQGITPRSYGEMGQLIARGAIDLGNPVNMLEFTLATFAEVIKHYNSDRFSKELTFLQEAA